MDALTPDTLKLLQSVLDEAWNSLRPENVHGQARQKLLYAFLKRLPQESEIQRV